MKGCSRGDAQSTRAAHIVHLQPEPRYRVVPAVGTPRVVWGEWNYPWNAWWDVLGDAWEGVGASHQQSFPILGWVWDMPVWVLMLWGISWLCSSSITEVNLSLRCPKRAVSNQIFILQSRANLTWFISVDKCDVQFLVGLSGMCVPLTTPPRKYRWHGKGGRRAPGDTGHGQVAALCCESS